MKRSPKEKSQRKALIRDMFPEMEASEHEYKQMERCFEGFLDFALEDEDEEDGLEGPGAS